MSYISAAALNRLTPALTPPVDAFTLPRDIPDAPGEASAPASAHELAPGTPSEDWRARGLAHPAGRGWEVAAPESPASPALSASPAAALLAEPDEARGTFTRERQVAFLSALAECGSVRAAASRSGVSYRTAYRARRGSPAFRQAWDGALLAARSVSEDVLATRAIDGVEEIVWFRGEEVGRRVRYDSRLLLAHLARLDKLTEHARTRAFADDCEGALERFAAGIDDPAPVCPDCGAALPVAAPAPDTSEGEGPGFSPGPCDKCDTAARSEGATAAAGLGGEAALTDPCSGKPLVWCPFVREMVDADTAQLNQMDAERPDWVLPPWEMAGLDHQEVECAQVAAYENGEDKWYLAVPPEDYDAEPPYRIAEAEEIARAGRECSGAPGGGAFG